MARKRKAFVHVGMPGVGDVVEAALVHHRDALAELGIDVPARSSQETFRAAVEVLREHKAWGFARAEVEGQWAQLCRRAWKGRQTVVVSQPLLSRATRPEIALLLDGLAGFEIHVVVTVTAPHAWTAPGEPETDLCQVLDRWGAAVRKPERLHVVLVETDAAQPARAQQAAWKGLGKVAGFGTASLGLDTVPRPAGLRPLTHPRAVPAERAEVIRRIARTWADRIEAGGHDVRGDLGAVLGVPPVAEPADRVAELDRALHDALREIERLARRNDCLEQRIAEVDRKRRKLKKRLSAVA